jgi:rod shape-determining protein MreD
MRRGALAVAVFATALLVQVTVVNRLPLPGTGPDLALVCLVAFALVEGPVRGAALGFAVGLACDVLPPADHAVGRLALVLTIVGYAAGQLEDAEERSVLVPVVMVGALSAAAVVLYAGAGLLVGDPRVTATTLARAVVSAVIYDVVLAPFIVPLVSGAVRRLEPEG